MNKWMDKFADARIEIWYLGSYRGYDDKLGVALMPNGKVFTKQEMYRVWAKDYIDTAFRLSPRFQRMDITPEELVLMKCICLLNPGEFDYQ